MHMQQRLLLLLMWPHLRVLRVSNREVPPFSQANHDLANLLYMLHVWCEARGFPCEASISSFSSSVTATASYLEDSTGAATYIR